ncbi:MAG: hypothetical protein ACE5JS_06385 [Nitrospinota bacterium]
MNKERAPTPLRTSFPGIVSVITSLGASICCLIPLAVIFLGLGTGAFMATTMKYRPLVFPLGVIGLGTGYYLYFREWRRCQQLACRMAGSRINLVFLIVATIIMAGVVWADFFSGALAMM